eukprot:s5575_g7.t1
MSPKPKTKQLKDPGDPLLPPPPPLPAPFPPLPPPPTPAPEVHHEAAGEGSVGRLPKEALPRGDVQG